ncbi:MAG: HDOD domain-containing protein [Lentisphaerales bacterium]|nr:HDOD domain-containing protein [Lentisphaerales bacterium]
MTLSPEALIDKCPDLATLPSVYHKLNEAINSPSCTTGIISRIISQDPALTLKVLKMVNSAFYGFPHEIEDIPQAIVIIGMQQLNDLVLTHSIINLFNKQKCAPFTLEDFWKFSLACGLEAKILASQSKGSYSERIFVGGLLHNIGKLLMAIAEPDDYVKCHELNQQESISMTEAETKVFGFNHLAVNRALMNAWNIPQAINEISSNYLSPEKTQYSQECHLIRLAHTVIQTVGLGNNGDFYTPNFTDAQMEQLQLTVLGLEESFIELKEQFSEITSTFLS